MRTCIIFNPAARGERARRSRRFLDTLGKTCVLKPTLSVGAGRSLAAEAVREGYETIIAAGGDGTLNEVLNGIGDEPDGFAQVRLGVLPVGTMNVFAREFGLTTNLPRCWSMLQEGHEKSIDLMQAVLTVQGRRERRYFGQLGGAGLDARAVELVNWKLKKKIGFLAYVIAVIQALCEQRIAIQVAGQFPSLEADSVLVGNGRLYAGPFVFFPQARADDARVDVCVYRRTHLWAVVMCFCGVVLRHVQPQAVVRYFQTDFLHLSSSLPVPIELDGELAGHLPAEISVCPKLLRLMVP